MWDYSKNPIAPDMISYGSPKQCWFKGECGHSWQSPPSEIRRGRGCPYCHGLRVLKGFNDLATKAPDIAEEWHPTKNGELTPFEVTYGSKQQVWWLGKCGHEWKSQINNRRNTPGCPVCLGRIVVPGINDLASQYPDIAEEWHPTKNGELIPEMITSHSNRNVWWLGKCGHEWKCQPNGRVNGTGCPICKKERSTSFAEKAIAFYLSKLTTTEESAHPLKSKKELDVYLPELKIAIEYDGEAYHRSIEKDMKKNRECEELGITLIRIREPNCPKMDNCQTIIMENRNDDGLSKAIMILLQIIFPNRHQYPIIDLDKDRTVIYERYIISAKEKSFADTHPELLRYWNKERNGTLNPDYVNTFSGKKLWWMCEKGHEWQATIANFTSGSRCPYCCGHKVLNGFNDLFTTNPEFKNIWDYEKNIIKPDTLSIGTHTKIWMKYPCGHSIYRRPQDNLDSNACPVCLGKIVIPGLNDITTEYPNLMSEWDYEKNEIDPSSLRPGSKKKVWWRCQKGHNYQKDVASRSMGYGCPYCSGRKLLPGFNDIATTNPELLTHWDYEKNYPLEPSQISKGSNKKVWWKCERGHTYQTTISNFVTYKNCPYCINKRVLEGFNDLSTTHSEIAAWWNYEKNIDILPTQVTRGSNKRVWWKCPNGHEFQKKVEDQVYSPRCPVCKFNILESNSE